jgi:hypothetical protein
MAGLGVVVGSSTRPVLANDDRGLVNRTCIGQVVEANNNILGNHRQQLVTCVLSQVAFIGNPVL